MKKLYLLFLLSLLHLQAQIVKPIPIQNDYDKSKAKLGQELFFDPSLSRDGTIACVNCHTLPGSGAESSDVSTGINGQQGPINSPTVLNARYNFKQFWDGRAETLLDQASGPITNPLEMGNTLERMLQTLKQNKHYTTEFKKVYKKLTTENVLDAIVEFEKALTTPNAKFDKFLRHEVNLTKEEMYGYKLFQDKGCISCHNGVNLGGSMFQKFGAFIELNETDRQRLHNGVDLGRYNVTGRDEDKYVFKVPTLRNIELSAPYFHDAKAKTLNEAIKTMALHQLGQELDTKDVNALESFLKTLTGETPAILVEGEQ